jgi:hypothetical protein
LGVKSGERVRAGKHHAPPRSPKERFLTPFSPVVEGAEEVSEAAQVAEEAESAGTAAEEASESAQMKALTNGDIKKLQANGIDPHDLKPNSKYDLFKDRNGDVFVKPKSGSGPGDPTGINLKELSR